jgi:hypothetical protein
MAVAHSFLCNRVNGRYPQQFDDEFGDWDGDIGSDEAYLPFSGW